MKILIAKDEAFNFIYRANIDELRNWGEVKFFSPLHDDINIECDMLYLPGGYPELYLGDIANNAKMMQRIKEYAKNGGRIFAECGGFMYLCKEIDGMPMCGVLPFKATMANAKLHLGYRTMLTDGGLIMKGHEFHYSEVIGPNSDVINSDSEETRRICCQLSAKGTPVDTPVYRWRNVVAGYTHWYWAEQGFPFFLFE